MTFTTLLLFIIIIQVIHFAGTWKLYQLAGRKYWEALIPVYNAIVLMKIINRSPWWTLLLFIPIVNLILFPVIWVEILRSFGKSSNKDTILVIITGGLYIYYINYTQYVTYIKDRSLKPRTTGGEWTSSILFAVVAATIVHTYVMQPFTIPTSSLEKTLLVGDFLFVSKFHYGARLPMTAFSVPMVHNTIPILHKKSYATNPQLPYFRIPGFHSIKRNDIVVFNWPADTLIDINNPSKGFKIKPLDKKSNYVKRCVGTPGDTLEVRDGYVFINGIQNELPDRAKLQFSYFVKTNGAINPQLLKDRYQITDRYSFNRENNLYAFAAITDESITLLKNNPKVIEVIKIEDEKRKWNPSIFPHDPRFSWNTKFFGPLYVPQQGVTIDINIENIPLYKRIIEVYEGSELGIHNKINLSGTEVTLNGSPLTKYTFLQDYYWMMGDNRDNSQDARMWGFVPYNHVVGKPVFVWLSWDSAAKGIANKIRTDRLFTTVGGEGKPVSYFKYFVIVLVGWFVFDFFRKKKKK